MPMSRRFYDGQAVFGLGTLIVAIWRALHHQPPHPGNRLTCAPTNPARSADRRPKQRARELERRANRTGRRQQHRRARWRSALTGGGLIACGGSPRVAPTHTRPDPTGLSRPRYVIAARTLEPIRSGVAWFVA
jgi:hypothetical protein